MRASKIASIWVATAAVCAPLVLVAEVANAAGALFRAKRTWWFSVIDSWTTGYVWPRSNAESYQPPAAAYVGKTAMNPMFTAPKSFIKNTTLFWSCAPPPYRCYPGYRQSRAWYSYWNAKGSFRPDNSNAPTTTTTIRFATTMSNPSPTTHSPHTARYDPVTPTTTWGGRYDFRRGGSIMIWPGPNRFGGTMRFFEGPNHRFYSRTTISGPTSTATIRARPLSQQLGTGVEIELGEVTEASVKLIYRITQTRYINREIIGTTPNGGPEYYVREEHFLVTRAPYTTGRARAWEPLGNTNTIHTATGYDNRTAAGLNGTISLVHPRLVHAYTVYPSGSGIPIRMTWSAAGLQKIDFRFLPEPAGIGLVVAGLLGLAGLSARRTKRRRSFGRIASGQECEVASATIRRSW